MLKLLIDFRYVLEVVVEGKGAVKYTLEELEKFPMLDVEATIQCAGNRRNEMSRVKTVKVWCNFV